MNQNNNMHINTKNRDCCLHATVWEIGGFFKTSLLKEYNYRIQTQKYLHFSIMNLVQSFIAVVFT